MLAATGHDRFLAQDYARLPEHGIRTVREGIRWHLVESSPGHYDFSHALECLHTAQEWNIQIIWDLMHFGYPDDVDPYSAEFIRRFKCYAHEFARVISNETDLPLFVTPINEMSFFAAQGGETGFMNPFTRKRGAELKAQFVRATIEGLEAIRDFVPGAMSVITEPVFNAVANSDDPDDRRHARAYTDARYEAWDMLDGRLKPELGGAPEYLDVVGVNYYPWNQWVYIGEYDAGPRIDRDDPRYIHLSQLLQSIYRRYERPLLISETSAEDDDRADWLKYVCEQALDAIEQGVQLEGICLYPIVSFPGWVDDRPSQNGLWGYADAEGNRDIYEPMAQELARCCSLFERNEPLYAS
jgi:beta-glucosidase/6-phospho-beta-glucosidase/beta-galactosidase